MKIFDPAVRRAAALALALIMALAVLPVSALRGVRNEGSPFREKASDRYDPERSPSPNADFSYIRVLISTGETSYVDIDLGTMYRLNGGAAIGGTIEAPLSLRVKVSGSNVKLTVKATGEELYLGPLCSLTRLTERYEAGYLTLKYSANSKTKGLNYLGDFRFMANSGYIAMINDISMTYYLFGIVGFELATNSFPESLKAQSLAAKAMGICYMDPSASYDVKDGWTSAIYQGYHGFDYARITTLPFIYETIGLALIYDGTFVPAYYGHANGGESALPSHNNFGSGQDPEYAVMIDDYEFEYPDSSRMFLHVDYNEPNSGPICDFILGKVIELFGVDAKQVTSINKVLLYDPLPGTQRNMRKLRIKATVEYASEGESGSAPGMRASVSDTLEAADFTIECAAKELHDFVLTDIDGSGDDYSEHDRVFYKSLKMYWGYAENGGYTLVHSRKGHGIGLSQIGSLARANPDTYAWNFREILGFYYPVYSIISITERPPAVNDDPIPPMEPIIAYGEISVQGADVRMGPSELYPIMFRANLNEHVDILSITSNEVLKVVFRGFVAYIHVSKVFVSRFPSPPNGVFTLVDGINPYAANLRIQPYSADEAILLKLNRNTAMTCWARVGKWCYVHTSTGLWGFISANVVTFGIPYEYTGQTQLSVMRYDLSVKNKWHRDTSSLPISP